MWFHCYERAFNEVAITGLVSAVAFESDLLKVELLTQKWDNKIEMWLEGVVLLSIFYNLVQNCTNFMTPTSEAF